MIKSTKIIGVDSKGGRRSRTGSTVSMGITDREAIDCQDYFLDLADGEEPMGKVKKIELVIYYEDDMTTEIKLPDTTELDKAITLEDVITEQDEELRALDHQFNNRWISEEYYDKRKAELLGTVENEHLPPNQRYLELGYEEFPGCVKCTNNPIDNGFCLENCCHRPIADKDWTNKFEVIPMSQRL